MENLKKYLNEQKGARILDVATGQGTFMSMISSVYDDYVEMIGIDTAERALEAISKNFTDPRISAMKMDINDMTFTDGYFDITCMSNSMHHMDDIDDAISKMVKVTNDNGVLIFNEMKSDNDSEKKMTHTYLHHFWAETDMLNGITHKETMTRDVIQRIFDNHPEVEIVDMWELEFDNNQEIDESTYAWLNSTIDLSLKRIEKHKELSEFSEKANLLKKRLSEVGFESATQVVVIAKKQMN
jgi:ubiquinone/menaquinone biosynthesis C-methylase UbiE